MRIALVSIVLAFFLAVQLQQSSSAVIGIDFGSQWYKIALIRSGFFDIILNEQSNRKTPNIVGWHQNDRFFGADALNLWSRNPSQSYSFINQVLGKTIDTPLFTQSKEFFPYTLVNDTERGSVRVVYEVNSNSESASSGFDGTFLPEELVSMILKRAKDQAEKFLGSSVVDCVLTVPPFLTHFERQALIDAGHLAGLNVLALINDITSFALNFGFIRTFTPEPQNVMFIDIGASSTSASIVEFSTIPDPKASKSSTPKEVTQVLIKSTAWNESIGGRAFDLRLVNHFKSHIKKSKPSIDVDDARITLKLMKEAQKMKEVLSANQQSTVSIGSLSGDYDFTLTVTRPQFEEMCADLFQSVSIPIQQILNELNLTKDDLTNVEVVGGASRIPKVQQILKELVGRGESQELDRHLNGDEAAAMGAVFYAASLSSSFKVKDIRLKDISSYPISVVLTKEENESEIIAPHTPEIEETTEAENEKEEEESPNLGESTALFGRQNRLGSKKGMTFYTNNNFSLLLQYGDENLIPEGTPQSIAQYTVTGIPTVEKYNFTGRPKVHASFRLSLSGVVTLEKVDAEITVLSYPKPTPPKEKEKEKSSESEKTVNEENQPKEGTTESESEKDEKEEEKEATEKPTDSENTAETSETEKEEKQTQSETESTNSEKEKATESTKAPTPVKKVIRVPLKIETSYLGVKPLSKSEKDRSERILRSFDQLDKDKAELQKEKNALESYIYEVREKLDWSENIEASTPEEREKLSEALSTAQDWLFEVEGTEGKEGAMLSDFKTKNKDLKFLAEKIFFRVQEKKNLPEDIATFLESINFAHKILSNITIVLNVTEEERDEVVREVDEISDWVKEKFKEQQSRLPFQDPILTTRDIARKSKEIETQMKLIMKKPKRKPITPTKIETVESNTSEDKNESSEKNTNEGENNNNAENENENLGDAHIEEENILSKDETEKLHDHANEKKHDEL